MCLCVNERYCECLCVSVCVFECGCVFVCVCIFLCRCVCLSVCVCGGGVCVRDKQILRGNFT